ncbi:uncharacterized protein LOC134285208 [Aedes albopictus]|uniref:Endonuclease n=1 Tax=Aedes albopictus TaxID=7160 RepID=A0ABM1XIT7_AEDAL
MSRQSAAVGTNTDGTPLPGRVDGYDHGVAGITASGSNSTPSVAIVPPPSTGFKVNVDVANNNVIGVAGTSSGNPVNIGQTNTIVNAGTANNVRRNPLREVRRNVDYRCQLCEIRDNEEMVQCDGCDRWFHFVCVHVTEDIANVSWVCPICKASSSIVPPTNADRIADRQRNVASQRKTTSLRSNSKASSRSEARRLRELEMKQLEDEFELEKRFLERKYKLLKECVSETSSVTEESAEGKLSKIEEWLAETERHGEAEDSGLVAEVANEQTPNSSGELEEHHALEVQRNLYPSILRSNRCDQRLSGNLPFSSVQQPIQQDHQAAFASTRPQYNRLSQGVHYANSTQLNAVHTLRQNERCHVGGNQGHSVYPQSQPRVVLSSQPERQCGQHSRELPVGQPFRQPSARREFVPAMNPNQVSEFVPGQRSTPIRSAQQDSGSPALDDETVCILNRSQIAARQAVSRDLPDFDGSLEDWPLFYAMFNSSTQMCGFTNEENMLRLRKCLKGKALEAVKCELLHPSNVADILSTLKMLYGRPEAIIQSIVKKIRHLPQPNTDKLESLVNFALTVKNMVATVRACEVNDFIFNASLRYELIERLPATLKLDWARFARNYADPNLADFSTWLYTIAEDASTVMATSGQEQRTRGSKKDGFLNFHSESEENDENAIHSPSKLISASTQSPIREPCLVCKGSCPAIAKCSRFVDFNYESKWATVKECKLCRKCLRKHNGSCKQQKKCDTNGCAFLHHPLLHKPDIQNSKSSGSLSEPTEPEPSCNVHQGQSAVLFRIVPVILYGPKKTIQTYAFIDDGSELTLIESTLAEELGVEGPKKSLCLKWTGGTRKIENESQQVNLKISGVNSEATKFDLLGISTLSSLQIRPQTMLFPELEKRFSHLKGLPLETYREVSPRLLIGLDYANLGHSTRSREGKWNEPIAVKTRLGWMIYGNCSGKADAVAYTNYHSVQKCECNQEFDDSLHKAMKSYFSLDSMGIVKPNKIILSQEDQRAQALLESFTRRTNNRYEAGLLWRYDKIRLPNSESMAVRRWKCLENRMNKDPTLAEALKQRINEHIDKGYVRKLTSDEINEPHARVWYLPVFAVVNPNKPDKIRVVWDAAASVHNVSLNSVLLKGPDQLTSLLSVLIRFREHRVAVCGDIKEMFHQIQIRKEDEHSQRFLWKNDGESEPSIYIVQVLTFGACCSPSIAQHVKNSNARQFEQDHPEAVEAIIKRHYVDDMLISVETEEQAVNLAQEVKEIHAHGGFEIHHWISNSTTVQAALTETASNEKNLDIGETDTTEKVLGMFWNTSTDCFTYKKSSRYDEYLLSGSRRPTKREVLRILMMIFDPMGFIAHILMFLKVLLQEIWRTPVGWDDPIEDTQFEKWMTWLSVFPKMETIEIPRCYRSVTSIQALVEMHTFVDASENGFAAVTYLRFQEGNIIECALAGAKTRVAPLKFLSIPRSELQAALLGVRLADSIMASLSITISKRHFWTDSKDVLCWLKSDHRRYSQFVAFRVSEILESTEINEWRWISTKLNVADEGTKWSRLPDLSSDNRWFRGPDFLWHDEDSWPVSPSFGGSTVEELRPHLLIHTTGAEPIIDPHNFSKWSHLLRRTAYLYRFIGNLRRSTKMEPRFNGPLTQEEFVKAENYLFRQAQSETYADEIAVLTTNCTNSSSKRIIRNNPLFRSAFVDENGVIRIHGRTQACPFVNRDAANPIILPRQHRITWLIVADAHEKFNHQNHATIINELLQRYRIPQIKATYHTVRRNCQYCKIQEATPQAPLMADLPQSRLAAFSSPFTYMGVDYFGPMLVSVGRRSEKRWGVLATCLTTRAIHLQITHTLTTDSCVMAIRNIMARRGVPAVIYSDRGTNFQATSKELKFAMQQLDHDRLANEFTSSHTRWSFIPPLSPHMGGAWERLIRSVKQNLAVLQPSRLPTDEVLQNAFIEVENIVNSRPLTDIPVDNDDSPVLTPNHFLLGSANGLRSWVPFDDSPVTLRNCYTQSQAMANVFWKRWLRDYLPTITRRTKWFTPVKPITVGDIVIIVDPKLPRNCWPKGRVIATHKAPDGQVRRATVQTASGGIYERSAVLLAVLDVGVRGNTQPGSPLRISGGTVNYAWSTPSNSTPLCNTHGGDPVTVCGTSNVVAKIQ